jgi:hypothetical protein
MILMTFYHRSNASCAEGFLNLLAIFNHSHFLKIGFESPIGGIQRETAVVTKSCRFTTGIALRHCLSSFPYINYKNE